jgi:hypothetical protein
MLENFALIKKKNTALKKHTLFRVKPWQQKNQKPISGLFVAVGARGWVVVGGFVFH